MSACKAIYTHMHTVILNVYYGYIRMTDDSLIVNQSTNDQDILRFTNKNKMFPQLNSSFLTLGKFYFLCLS